ncbi:hypothetical protein, partial [Streptococcus danieliae]|uniref:hypothetical protein n=1 Tax=Streptococcus danieliae TaxID=747656 RepID=UPI0026F277E4
CEALLEAEEPHGYCAKINLMEVSPETLPMPRNWANDFARSLRFRKGIGEDPFKGKLLLNIAEGSGLIKPCNIHYSSILTLW